VGSEGAIFLWKTPEEVCNNATNEVKVPEEEYKEKTS